MLQNLLCWILVVVTPASLVAADVDSGAGMLYGKGKGTVWLNGEALPRSSAVFPGDLVQTQPESLATLDFSGSGVTLMPDSTIKLERNAVSLQHGAVSVGTGRRMVALAGKVTVTPVSNAWTGFEVVEANGTVQVAATEGDVNVNCGKGTVNLSPGERVTSDESGNCNKKRRGGAAVPTGGGVLTNPYVQAGSLISGGTILCLLLCTSAKPFVSQWKP